MTIREDAINRVATPLFETCARNESLSVEQLMDGVARGELVITKNNDMVTINPPGSNNETRIYQNGSSYLIKPPGSGNETRVTREANKVVVDPPGWKDITTYVVR